MTEVESPSALLERAAEKVTHETKWNLPAAASTQCSRCHPAPRCLCLEEPSNYWLATMPRDAAQPLVEWLRDTADDLRAENEQVEASSTQYALTFARQILGEAS